VLTKSLTLEGGWRKDMLGRDWDTYTTTIDAHRSGSAIRVKGNISPTIEGFIITGGDASSYLGWGGGILADGDWGEGGLVTIRHNVIIDNLACQISGCQGYGGGIMVYSNRAIIEYNQVISNVARAGGNGSGRGGGLSLWGYPSQVTLTGNVIVSNTAVFSPTGSYAAGEGGGVWSEGACDVTARDNEIRDNVATAKGDGRGGGIYACGRWYENRILSNTASISGTSYGGGVYAYYVPDFDDNVVQGNVASQSGDGTGGGVYAVYLQDAYRNTIVDNAATRGGGVYFREYVGQQTFSDNLVSRNRAIGLNVSTPDGGGGIASQADRVEIIGNDIRGNAALAGGGVLVTAGDRYQVHDNRIQGNVAYAGGGMFVYSATGSIVNNQVIGNGSTWWGGGMYLWGRTSPVMDGNIVMSNAALGYQGFAGGGIILAVEASTRVTLTNHMIVHNAIVTGTAAGIHCVSGSCALIHCTVVDNKLGTDRGEGIRLSAGGGVNIVWNSIIAGHDIGVNVLTGTAALDHNDYYDNNVSNVSSALPGAHSLTDDPQFANRAAGDYHLTLTSPLINMGDIGADEYVLARIYLPVIMRDWSGMPPGG
jgi:hypothetical protein